MGQIQAHLVKNHTFIVTLNSGVYSFSKVTNLSASMELETWNEGGYNESPRFFPKPKTTNDTLILEYGIKTNKTDTALCVGTPITISAIIVKHENKIARTYSFEYGIITKCEIGELNAMNAEVLVRRIEISHTGLFEL